MNLGAVPNSPKSIQRFAWSVVWQVGLMLVGIIGGSFALGMLADRLVGTRATFLLIALLLSIPINLAAVYFYCRNRMRNPEIKDTREVAQSD